MPKKQSTNASFQRALQYFQQGDYPSVARLLKKACRGSRADPDSCYLLALACVELGQLDKALAACDTALAGQPAHPGLHVTRGVVLEKQQHYEDAVAAYERARALQPGSANIHFNLGNAHAALGNLELAETAYRRALEINPDDHECLLKLARLLPRRGDHATAEQCFRKSIKLFPYLASTHYHYAAFLNKHARLEEALACLKRAIDLKPDYQAPYRLAGEIYLRRTKLDSALAEQYRQLASQAKPVTPEEHHVLGHVLYDSGDHAAATQHFERAIELLHRDLEANPNSFDANADIARTLVNIGRLEEARQYFEKALELKPGNTDIINELSKIHLYSGDPGTAIELLDKALELQPDATSSKFAKAVLLILLGNYREGWQLYEERLHHTEVGNRHQEIPLWEGQPLANKSLLIQGEQGLGDEIMFASCVPDICRQPGSCLIECHSKLLALFARSFPECRIRKRGELLPDAEDDATGITADYRIPMGSLPKYFRNTLGDFPAHDGYLKADPARTAGWQQRLEALGPGTKIGISWRGGVPDNRMFQRSIDLGLWLPILTLESHHFISLQYTPCENELQAFAKEHDIHIHHWQEAIEDYEETAALVSALDLVISVQTSLIHLAGALNKATWGLISSLPEWRYGMRGDTMPWYPAVKLFRQQSRGDWPSVMIEVKEALRSLSGIE